MILNYTVYKDIAYLTDIKYGGDHIEIHIAGVESGLLTLGKRTLEIKDGVGRVKISSLKDGVHTPRISTKGQIYYLAPISLSHGVAGLCNDGLYFARLSAQLLELRMCTDALLEQTKRLADAVFGKAIF